MEPFVHLHVHTEYSLLDGAARIERIWDACKERNFPAVAITDHGNMFGTLEFHKQAKAHGVKPIIGCEFYMCHDMKSHDTKNGGFFHLVLLAKDERGYKNIIKLDSLAFTDGFYYKPRIDMELLKQHTEGVVCLSACLAGEIPQLLLANRYDDAKALAKQFQDLFGEDYYIELQDHGIRDQKYVNPLLIKIARELNIKLVATNDVHYINREDHEMHDVLLCVQTGKTIDDPTRMKFETDEFYMKNYDEMLELFPNVPEALTNTLEIADKCNFEFKFHQPLLPNYVPDDGSTPREYLRKLAEEGIRRRYGDKLTNVQLDRMNYELGIVDRMGFNEYYLIVWDFINWARLHDIPVGAGRGSGVGSIVAYSIGITNVEPLQYNLLFERFLNPERQSMPDFDIDFCFERRQEVIEYVKEKYGEGKVSQIVTFGTMASKNAIRDVARVYKIPLSDVSRITGAMNVKGTIATMFGLEKSAKYPVVPELVAMYQEDANTRNLIDMARKLEGMPRNTGMHAAGVVICKDVISDHVPMQVANNAFTTQYDMIEVEELGLLKMDFLALKTLTDVKKAITYAEETTGTKIDFEQIGYSDRGAYELIGEGDTDAVFQLEGAGMKKFMRELLPDCLEDIIAGISLYRPGPMDSIPKYIEGKKNQDKVTYAHPMLEDILNVTYGCMVYQEQVMQICQKMAGFSFGQADMVRRAMGKKDLKKMLKMKDIFIYGEKDANGNQKVDGAVNRGVPLEIATNIFEEMEKFASYAFNKSHAAAYAVLAYQTAYLKKYYRTCFIAAVLNNRITNIEEITKYTTYCRENNIPVLPPDINKSRSEFRVEGEGIRFGLSALKNVGGAATEAIVEEREKNGEFKSMTDFLERVDIKQINKRLMESLIKGGAFDCFGLNRSQLMAGYEKILDLVTADKKQQASGQISLFLLDTVEEPTQENFPDVPEYERKEKLNMEKEVLGVYVTGHPLEEFMPLLKTFSFNTSMLQDPETDEDGNVYYGDLKDNMSVTAGGIIAEFRKMITKSGSDMAVARLEDVYGSVEMVMFARNYERNKRYLAQGNMVKVTGRLSIRPDEAVRLMPDKIEPLMEEKPFVPKAPRQEAEKRSSRLFYLRFGKDVYGEISEILECYPGEVEVRAVIEGKTMRLPHKVRECSALLSELSTVLDETDMVFKEVAAK